MNDEPRVIEKPKDITIPKQKNMSTLLAFAGVPDNRANRRKMAKLLGKTGAR